MESNAGSSAPTPNHWTPGHRQRTAPTIGAPVLAVRLWTAVIQRAHRAGKRRMLSGAVHSGASTAPLGIFSARLIA